MTEPKQRYLIWLDYDDQAHVIEIPAGQDEIAFAMEYFEKEASVSHVLRAYLADEFPQAILDKLQAEYEARRQKDLAVIEHREYQRLKAKYEKQ